MEAKRVPTWRWSRVAIATVLIAALGLFWFTMAPTSMGGDATYVVTSGISMEPHFHTGDLAILRPAGSYHVGEIVGYISPRIGIVLHRIIGVVGGRFLMKGDNNDFVDSFHPLPSDVVGRLWLHVPKLGHLFNDSRYRKAGVVVTVAAMAGTIGIPAQRERRRRRIKLRRGEDTPGTPNRPRRSARYDESGSARLAVLGVTGQLVASVIALVALAALVLGAFAFSRATTSTSSVRLTYRQLGQWSYRAIATGNVYAGGAATTGQPIFYNVAPAMTVEFSYQLAASAPLHVAGQARLAAVISSPDGWTHDLPMGPAVPLAAGVARLVGTVNLSAIRKYLDVVAAQTGQLKVAAGPYTLTLQPTVVVSGSLGNTPLKQLQFGPPLAFSLQSNEAVVYLGPGGSSMPLAKILQPIALGGVSVPVTTSASIVIFGLHPSVTATRALALWLLLACLLGSLVLVLLWRTARRAPDIERIDARYGSLMVAVERPSSLVEVGSVRVARMEDLVKIAEYQGRMIFHCEGESGHDYFVRDPTSTYLFTLVNHARNPESMAVATTSADTEGHSPGGQ